ncbi:MAG: hypothetical protein IJT83_12330, partial [Victivallales bacterium]|nr:hypothetical protein [Victivallales bacterium]
MSKVSHLYLDELAGRREKVVENNLNDNIRVMEIALGMIDEKSLINLEHLRAYQQDMKQLFKLERFAFVDEAGSTYTANEGITQNVNLYSFDYKNLSKVEISVRKVSNTEKNVVIAMPLRDRKFFLGGKQLLVCFMEINMDIMLSGVSMKSQSSATFCNIFTRDGYSLSNMVLGGLATEDNLLEALEHAQMEEGYSLDKVLDDF